MKIYNVLITQYYPQEFTDIAAYLSQEEALKRLYLEYKDARRPLTEEPRYAVESDILKRDHFDIFVPGILRATGRIFVTELIESGTKRTATKNRLRQLLNKA